MRAIYVLILLVSAIFPATALAEKRVALVIGNSAYQHVPQLANPKNDAADMAAKLEGLGFEVVQGEDLDLNSMRNTAREFTKKLEGADISLFFYAGHGLQVNGSNYMAPVDAKLASYDDLEYEAVPMDLILTTMERKTKVNLVFLDACRDNPLAENLSRSMGTRSTAVGRGLAKLGSGVGSLIAFATQPGNVALDGEGRNSPFTTALLKHLGTPGQSVTDDLIQVRKEVLDATQGKQVPWDNSSLTGPVVLKPVPKAEPEPSTSSETTTFGKPDNAVELAYWDAIKDATDPRLLEAYIKKYPNGAFVDLAQIKIELLKTAADQETKHSAAKAETAAAADAKNRSDAKPVDVAKLEQPSTPAGMEPEARSVDLGELALEMQKELARVGCLSGRADGKWGPGSERALKDYAGRQGIQLASLQPAPDLLDRLKATAVRVCPLVCGNGLVEKNGRCEKVKREAKAEPKPEPRKQAADPKQATPTSREQKSKTAAQAEGRTCWKCKGWVGGWKQVCGTNEDMTRFKQQFGTEGMCIRL